MKSFCILAIVFAVVVIAMTFPDEKREMELKVMNECRSIVEGVTDDDVKTFMTHNVPTTRSGKCLNACFLEKLGDIEDGKMSAMSFKASGAEAFAVNEEAICVWNEMVDECVSSAVDADKCELAAKIYQCMQNAKVKRNFNERFKPTDSY